MYEYKARDILRPEENISIQKCFVEGLEKTHTHDFIEIVYIMAGSGQHFINDICYNVERGDLLFINFKETHSIYPVGPMTYINCLLKPEFLGRELVDSENAFEILALTSFEDFEGKVDRMTPKVGFKGKDLIEIETIIEQMIREFGEKHIGYRAILKGYISVLLAKIFREMRNSDVAGILQHVNKITPEIIKYIEENCFEKITLKELAQKCFYNPSYFSRVFKEYYGKNLTDFIHEKRVTEAMRLLKETTLSIEDICYGVGYKEKKQFYKIFKEYIGVTPSRVRSTI